jgi:hypothetical protein
LTPLATKNAEIMVSPLIGVSRVKPWISDAGKLTGRIAREMHGKRVELCHCKVAYTTP